VTPTEKEEVDLMTELLGVSAADYLMHLHRRAMKDLDRQRDREGGRGPRRMRPHDPRDARRSPRRRRDEDDDPNAGVIAPA
jgi:hypothetical protein